MASGKQIDVGALFPKMDDGDIWEERSEEVCESVMGIVSLLQLELEVLHVLI